MKDVEKTQKGAVVLSLSRRSGKNISHWAYYLEGEKGGRGQDKRRG